MTYMGAPYWHVAFDAKSEEHLVYIEGKLVGTAKSTEARDAILRLHAVPATDPSSVSSETIPGRCAV